MIPDAIRNAAHASAAAQRSLPSPHDGALASARAQNSMPSPHVVTPGGHTGHWVMPARPPVLGKATIGKC